MAVGFDISWSVLSMLQRVVWSKGDLMIMRISYPVYISDVSFVTCADSAQREYGAVQQL